MITSIYINKKDWTSIEENLIIKHPKPQQFTLDWVIYTITYDNTTKQYTVSDNVTNKKFTCSSKQDVIIHIAKVNKSKEVTDYRDQIVSNTSIIPQTTPTFDNDSIFDDFDDNNDSDDISFNSTLQEISMIDDYYFTIIRYGQIFQENQIESLSFSKNSFKTLIKETWLDTLTNESISNAEDEWYDMFPEWTLICEIDDTMYILSKVPLSSKLLEEIVDWSIDDNNDDDDDEDYGIW